MKVGIKASLYCRSRLQLRQAPSVDPLLGASLSRLVSTLVTHHQEDYSNTDDRRRSHKYFQEMDEYGCALVHDFHCSLALEAYLHRAMATFDQMIEMYLTYLTPCICTEDITDKAQKMPSSRLTNTDFGQQQYLFEPSSEIPQIFALDLHCPSPWPLEPSAEVILPAAGTAGSSYLRRHPSFYCDC